MKKNTLLLFFVCTLFTNYFLYAQNGIITTFAGTGAYGHTGDGGPALLASIDSAANIANDRFGNIYIGEEFYIRKVDNNGIITTIAGNGTQGYTGDGGLATLASIFFSNYCGKIVADGVGNIYFFQANTIGNHVIRKIDASGMINTIAGNGSISPADGVPATNSRLYYYYSHILSVDSVGNIYFTDSANIWKISTSGIINNYAGFGNRGFSGDGGPSTAAKLNSPFGLAIDKIGNLYIADYYNYRIRKIDTAGIITTIAGNGLTGGDGDGKNALFASVDYVYDIAVDNLENVYLSDYYRIRKINKANGRINTIAGTNTGYSLYEGNFELLEPIYCRSLVIDSYRNIYYPDYGNKVNRILQPSSALFYWDLNNNCILDTNENFAIIPFLISVDSNGIRIDTFSVLGCINYFMKGGVGDIYKYTIINMPTSFSNACSGSNVFYDTLTSNTGKNFSKNIGLKCTATTNYDLGTEIFTISGRHAQKINILAYNSNCSPESATLTVNFDSKYNFISAIPYPSSVSGNVITWSLSPIYYDYPKMLSVYLDGGTLTIGDTVKTISVITPIFGDIDTSNNYMVIIDTVTGSFDPNEISVYPSGNIPPNAITNLEYSISFENTGNDTAYNIYIIDSLSNYLDPQSLRLEIASAKMTTTRINVGGQNIVKFEFPNINLLDSSHHGLCDGNLKFNINTKPGLPIGTTINNHVGIYFDSNPVVITNTVTNYMSNTQVPIVGTNSKIDLFPNPATNQLTIKTSDNTYNSFTISNIIGMQMIQQSITGNHTNVDVAKLPNGVYYVTFKGETGDVVKKFVKM